MSRKTYRKINAMARFKRFLLTGASAVLVLMIGVFVFLEAKKNDIARDVLAKLNKRIEGEITVEAIKISNWIDYPEVRLEFKEVSVYSEKKRLSSDVPVISIDELYAYANVTDVLEGHYGIQDISISGGEVRIEPEGKGWGIATAFLPIEVEEKEEAINNSNGFKLSIDTVIISGVNVVLSLGEKVGELNLYLDSVRTNFNMDGNFIGINAAAWGETQEIDAQGRTILSSSPFIINTNLVIDIEEKIVSAKTPVLDLFQTPLQSSFSYVFGKDKNLKFLLESTAKAKLLNGMAMTGNNESAYSLADGYALMEMNLEWQPKSNSTFVNDIVVELHIEGRDIRLKGVDLDHLIDNFESSQHFNLIDISAVLLTGPAGLLITKGTDYTMLLTNSDRDSSTICHLNSDWLLANGLLTSTDVAFKTEKNLVATQCNYNLGSDSLDLKVMVIDKKGCTLISQSIYGTGNDLKLSRVNYLETLLGPIINFFRDIGLGKCNQEYHGKVFHPANVE